MEQTEAIKKISIKAKNLKFHTQREGTRGSNMVVVFAQEVCMHPDYPNFYFVIASNMHYHGGELKDTSYTAYTFSLDGDFIEKVDFNTDLPSTFMRDRKTYVTIE
jgi:hypothetical protein